MLDFAIFAVTFLLALVGAVLYLYPVTPDSGGEGAPAPQGPGRPVRGERSRESHVAPPRSAVPVRMRAVVLGGSRIPSVQVGVLEVALNYLG